MARTPPQAASPRHHQRTARRRVTTTCGARLDAGCARLSVAAGNAHAQRTCEQWSADITAVEGRVEVRRRDNPNWVSAHDRRARLHRRRRAQPKLEPRDDHLARRRHLAARREQRAGAPRATFGTGFAGRAAPRCHSRHQPRSALPPVHYALRQRGPRGNRVRHSRRREQPSHGDRRARRRGRRFDTGGRAQRRERPCRGRERGRSSDRVTVRGADRTDALGKLLPADRRSRTPRCRPRADARPSGPTPPFTRLVQRRAWRRRASRRPKPTSPDALRIAPRQRDGTVAERPARPRARRPRGRTRAPGASARRRAELGRRAAGLVARRAELRSARGGRPHVARGARARARQQPSSSCGSPRLPWLEAMRETAIANATRARSLAPTQSAPLVVLGFANLRAFDTAAAESAFAAAVELEPDAPLPRLGLALASIHRGDLAEGRRQLELAVALDPANAVDAQLHGQGLRRRASRRSGDQPTRSRQGFRSRRSDSLVVLVAAEPAHQSARRGVSGSARKPRAGTATGRSSRSWLPLDEDIATRSAGLGRVHNELGFGRLALIDAWQAIGDDPTELRRSSVARGRVRERAAARESRASASCSFRSCCSLRTSRRSSRSLRSRICSSRSARGRATRRSTSSRRR